MSLYISKFGLCTNGDPDKSLPTQNTFFSSVYSGITSMIGMFTVLIIEYKTDFTLVAASFGASAVLLFNAYNVPFSQPRNVIGGQVLSSIVGCSCRALFMLDDGKYFYKPLVGSLSVGFSIFLMDITRTTHPPGAATALIAVVGSQEVLDMGFMFVIYPVLTGISLLTLIALLTNNFLTDRKYPNYWV